MMKKILRKLGAFFLSAAMLASLAVNAAAVDADANPPEEVRYAVSTNAYSGAIGLEFGEDYADWINAIIGVEVNGTKYNIGRPEFPCRDTIVVMRELNSPEWRFLPPQL